VNWLFVHSTTQENNVIRTVTKSGKSKDPSGFRTFAFSCYKILTVADVLFGFDPKRLGYEVFLRSDFTDDIRVGETVELRDIVE
jgi:hypothetical protein